MQLTHLASSHIHNRFAFDHATGPLTVITGKNEAGKSTLIGLISLVTNGPKGKNWPVLGETPTYDCSATLTFDDGTKVGRGIVMGKHACLTDGRWAGPRAGHGQIVSAVGASSYFSISAFLGLSAAKRLDWLEQEILGVSKWDAEKTATATNKLLLTATTSAVVTIHNDVVTEDCGGEVFWPYADKLKELATESDRTIRARRGAIKTMDAELAGFEVPGGTIPMHDGRIEEIDAELGTLREQDGKEKAQDAERARLSTAIEGRQTEIESWRASDFAAERTIIMEKVAENTRSTDAATTVLETARASLLKAEATHVVAAERMSGTGLPVPVRGLIDDIREYITVEVTPQHPLLDRIDQLLDDNKDTAARVLKMQLDAATRTMDAARKDVRVALSALDGLEKYMVGHTSALESVSGSEKQRDSKITEWSKEVESNQALINALTVSDPTQTAALKSSLEEERADLKKKIQKLNDHAGLTNSRRQADQEKVDATADRTAAKERLALVEPLKAEQIREGLEPLNTPLMRISACALVSRFAVLLVDESGLKLSYCNADRPGAPPVDYNTCSRSTQVVIALSLRAAIIEKVGGWRCLEVDNFEHLDIERRDGFLAAVVAEMNDGHLDNVVVASVTDGWTPPAMATHINLDDS